MKTVAQLLFVGLDLALIAGICVWGRQLAQSTRDERWYRAAWGAAAATALQLVVTWRTTRYIQLSRALLERGRRLTSGPDREALREQFDQHYAEHQRELTLLWGVSFALIGLTYVVLAIGQARHARAKRS